MSLCLYKLKQKLKLEMKPIKNSETETLNLGIHIKYLVVMKIIIIFDPKKHKCNTNIYKNRYRNESEKDNSIIELFIRSDRVSMPICYASLCAIW